MMKMCVLFRQRIDEFVEFIGFFHNVEEMKTIDFPEWFKGRDDLYYATMDLENRCHIEYFEFGSDEPFQVSDNGKFTRL